MTLFEYLAIAFSLVLSTTAMRLMGGIPHALDASRRYWVHLAFVFWQLTTTTGVFWTFWSLRNAEWIYPTFLLQLANLGFLYVNACILVPENPASVKSWREYYYSVRARYFLMVGTWVLVVATAGIVMGVPILHPIRAVQGLLLIGVLVGALSEKPRVHAALAILGLAMAVIASVGVILNPDPLSPG